MATMLTFTKETLEKLIRDKAAEWEKFTREGRLAKIRKARKEWQKDLVSMAEDLEKTKKQIVATKRALTLKDDAFVTYFNSNVCNGWRSIPTFDNNPHAKALQSLKLCEETSIKVGVKSLFASYVGIE